MKLDLPHQIGLYLKFLCFLLASQDRKLLSHLGHLLLHICPEASHHNFDFFHGCAAANNLRQCISHFPLDGNLIVSYRMITSYYLLSAFNNFIFKYIEPLLQLANPCIDFAFLLCKLRVLVNLHLDFVFYAPMHLCQILLRILKLWPQLKLNGVLHIVGCGRLNRTTSQTLEPINIIISQLAPVEIELLKHCSLRPLLRLPCSRADWVGKWNTVSATNPSVMSVWRWTTEGKHGVISLRVGTCKIIHWIVLLSIHEIVHSGPSSLLIHWVYLFKFELGYGRFLSNWVIGSISIVVAGSHHILIVLMHGRHWLNIWRSLLKSVQSYNLE